MPFRVLSIDGGGIRGIIPAVVLGRLEALTADHYNQAFEHVRSARAHRTYTEVHGLVVQILINQYTSKWTLGVGCG